MLTLPTIIERTAQPYVAIKERVTPPFNATLDRVVPELFGWLGQRGIEPAGPLFFKYNFTEMGRPLEIEFGLPTATKVDGDARVMSGTLPAGRFASLTYFGPYENLFDANAVLIGWAKEKSIRWDIAATPEGEKFGCRLEIYKTDPGAEPNSEKWETEVAIRIAD
jgi:effector-binding domain-containing protein